MKTILCILALAASALPTAAQTKKQKATGDAIKAPQLSPLPAEQRLIDLKKSFPAQKKTRVSGGHAGSIEIEIPSNEIYSYYHGAIATVTLDSLSLAVAKLEAKIPTDVADLKKKAAELPANSAEQKKMSASAAWLTGEFKSYLAKLKGLATSH